jgi:hypothetical protein
MGRNDLGGSKNAQNLIISNALKNELHCVELEEIFPMTQNHLKQSSYEKVMTLQSLAKIRVEGKIKVPHGNPIGFHVSSIQLIG